MVYDEAPSDSVGTRLGGSVLNAIIVVCGITAMTFMFVLCFKYRLYKVGCWMRRLGFARLIRNTSSFCSFGWVCLYCPSLG